MSTMKMTTLNDKPVVKCRICGCTDNIWLWFGGQHTCQECYGFGGIVYELPSTTEKCQHFGRLYIPDPGCYGCTVQETGPDDDYLTPRPDCILEVIS